MGFWSMFTGNFIWSLVINFVIFFIGISTPHPEKSSILIFAEKMNKCVKSNNDTIQFVIIYNHIILFIYLIKHLFLKKKILSICTSSSD